MSEQVKLTKEQVSAIETFLRDNGNDKLHLVDWHNANKPIYLVETKYQPLMTLKASALATALFIGYELEQSKFQKDDKVVRIDGKRFANTRLVDVIDFVNETTQYAQMKTGWQVPLSDIRLAEPTEIFWLDEMNREKVDDFRVGDILVGKDHVPFVVVSERTDTEIGFINKNDVEKMICLKGFNGLLPAESFKRFKK